MDDVKEHRSIICHCKRPLSELITHLVRAYLVRVLPRSAGGPRLIGPRLPRSAVRVLPTASCALCNISCLLLCATSERYSLHTMRVPQFWRVDRKYVKHI
jgi:hypothetical protein